MGSKIDDFVERYELKGAELKVGAPVWIDVNFSQCTGCGWCIDVCSENVFILNKIEADKKVRINISKCINCGNCTDVCKPQAIVDHSCNHIQDYLSIGSKIYENDHNDNSDKFDSP